MTAIRRELIAVNRRIRNLSARGIVQLSDAGKLLQTLQLTVLKDEVLDNVEHFEPHGFTSRPKKGSEAIILCQGGNRSSAITIMVSDRRVRLQGLAEGEVALYDDADNKIHLKQNGTVAIASPKSVDVTAPDVTMSGNLTVIGDISGANLTASGNVSDANGDMAEIRSVFNGHKHPGDSGGTTGTPDSQMT